MKKLLTIMVMLSLVFGLAACDDSSEPPVQEDKKAPTITVNDTGIVTMIKGDRASLSGVTANDENDGDLTSSITISDTYDINVSGYYDVTLSVTDSDSETTTADAKLYVKYEEPIVVKGETWNVDPTEMKSLIIFDIIENFNDGDLININLESVIGSPVIFYNTSDTTKTISVTNPYGVAALLNANGVVVEGRDGANGRLVDDTCGLRTLCPLSSLDADDPLSNLVIEPGGYAIVAPFLSSEYNEDGRKFINEQVINRLNKVVPLEMDGKNIYTYKDQAPYVVISGKIQPSGSFTLTGTKDVEINLLDGLQFFDDNGAFGDYVELIKSETFDPVVSVVIYDEYGNELIVNDPTAFTFENEGVYDFEIIITDGTNQRLIETQMNVIVFEELTDPAFRIKGDIDGSMFEYIDLMRVPYTYNFLDIDDIDTALYHIYDDYTQLLNAIDSTPHDMGWGSFIIFDEATGTIEVNYNIFHDKLFVADGVDYIDPSLFEDAKGLEGITDLPEGKVLLVGGQGTDLRALAFSNTSRDLTGLTIEFINVDEVDSITPTFDTPTLVISTDTDTYPIEIPGYAYNPTHPGTNNMPTGTVEIFTDYNNILGLDGTPLNMGYGSYMIVDEQTKVIEVYGNWANVFTIDGVDYVDGSNLNPSEVLDTITSLPEGKILIVSPQGTSLRDELHNTVGTNTDITGTVLGMYEVYENPSLVITYNGTKEVIDITGYTVDPTHPGTNNMPTGAIEFVTDYNNILGLDGTPVNMGWGSYLIVDQATMTIEVYGNWANVFIADGVTYADGTNLNGAEVLDTISSLPEGKLLIICPQGTDLRDALFNDLGNNSDLTGITIDLYMVKGLN